jgi:hypothetical protein
MSIWVSAICVYGMHWFPFSSWDTPYSIFRDARRRSSPTVRQHLPRDLIEAFGEPIVIGSAAESLRKIQAA